MSDDVQGADHSEAIVYDRDSLEFSRLNNLCDAVFAIAMTVLVLTIDIPDVSSARLAEALLSQIPQYVAFAISFGVVANVWWRHHQFMSWIKVVDPVMIAINLLVLGVVVVVPFPTALIGNAHFARAAVMPFLGVFIAINILFVLLILRAHKVDAWRWKVPLGTFYWMVFNYIGGIVILALALILAVWFPLASLMIVAASVIVGPLVSGIWHRRYGEIDD